MERVELRRATPDALGPVLALLRACGLPTADLQASHMPHFTLALDGDLLIGLAGIEPVAQWGLLRSVAVSPGQRRRGVGAGLLRACEAQATEAGLDVLFMIAKDEAAARHFRRAGYEPVARADVPAALLALPEFSQLCPASRPCLRKRLAAHAVTIYHNPACGTSRNTLAMIRNAGIEPQVIEYLGSPPERNTLVRLIEDAGLSVRAALREKCEPFVALGLADAKWSDEALLDFMGRYPILINRPFVVSALGTRLCRPSEVVLEILPGAQRGAFSKEDGEAVVDAAGQRIKPPSVARS